MNKKRIITDNYAMNDIVKKTEVIVCVEGTDEVVFKGSNKIILPGSQYTAAKHFNIPIPHTTPSYNEVLNLDNSVDDPNVRPNLDEEIILFSMGTDGCGVDAHQIYDVNYAMWCKPEDMVPFRVVDPLADLGADLREVYFGRCPMFSGTKIGYYFKRFEAAPEYIERYISDGTPVGSDVYNSHRTDEIEAYVGLKLKVGVNDAKEYFENTIGIKHTKINTISLHKASFITIDGYKYFQGIRPVTKINFSNDPLFELNKGLDIYYNVYY